MAQIWNLEGRFEGRVLGLDKFQIAFRSESEFLQVLKKGPYHYKRWMILLQRWEPTVQNLFPTNISFNVRIHGISLQYWSEGTILTIGSELGKCIVRDVKEANIWVEINGLQPLIMRMEIECPTEDVTEVEFEYIKIEKHCFTCFSLFHEENDCPHRPHNALPRRTGYWESLRVLHFSVLRRRKDVTMKEEAIEDQMRCTLHHVPTLQILLTLREKEPLI